jgi:Glycosyl transferases group 1
MAMGKAAIVTRTRGQVDVVREGVSGLYVPPGDARGLRQAIEHLLAHPEEAARMGRAGRELVEANHTLDRYVERVARIVRESGKPRPQDRLGRDDTARSQSSARPGSVARDEITPARIGQLQDADGALTIGRWPHASTLSGIPDHPHRTRTRA